MDAVWQYSFYSDTSTVTVHIRRLRAKIEPDPASGPRTIRPCGASATGSRREARARSLVVAAAALAAVAVIGLRLRRAKGVLTLASLAVARRRRARSRRTCSSRGGGASARCDASSRSRVAVGVRPARRRRRASRGADVRLRHDALMVAVLALFAGAVAVRAAQLLAGGVCATSSRCATAWTPSATGAATSSAPDGRGRARPARRFRQPHARRLAGEEDARRDLVAAVSHDLRTPITSLRLLADAVDDDILDERDPPPLPRAMAHAHARARGADRRPVRALAAGGRRHRLDDGAGARSTRSSRRPSTRCAPQARAPGVAVRADVAGRARRRAANPEKLQRVLFNLIQNAIRHTPADGSVTVRAPSRRTTAVEIEVADTGAGHRGRRARARLRAVLPRRREAAARARRRARARDLARDRRGPRRAHLAGRVGHRNPRALLAADGRRGRRSDPTTPAVAPLPGRGRPCCHRRGGGATATVRGSDPSSRRSDPAWLRWPCGSAHRCLRPRRARAHAGGGAAAGADGRARPARLRRGDLRARGARPRPGRDSR